MLFGFKFVIVKFFFFVELLKFISDFKSIKLFMAFEKITNIVEEYYVCNRLISF